MFCTLFVQKIDQSFFIIICQLNQKNERVQSFLVAFFSIRKYDEYKKEKKIYCFIYDNDRPSLSLSFLLFFGMRRMLCVLVRTCFEYEKR